jgi:hypothetical protein
MKSIEDHRHIYSYGAPGPEVALGAKGCGLPCYGAGDAVASQTGSEGGGNLSSPSGARPPKPRACPDEQAPGAAGAEAAEAIAAPR